MSDGGGAWSTGRRRQRVEDLLLEIQPWSKLIMFEYLESIEHAETTAEQNERDGLQVPAFRVQLRAGKVLGDVGDVRALPILEKLLKETKTVDYWYAIQQVKKKNGMKYRHWPAEDDPRPHCARSFK
jgi:hypothetical protein